MDLFGLHDVDFEFESDRRMDNLPRDFVTITHIDISDLSGMLTAGVLSYADISGALESVSIDHCPLTEVSNVPHSCELMLKDIPTPQDICHYISSWRGSFLEVHDSPGFNDVVLEMLSLILDAGGMKYTQDLIALDLYNCTNISIEALKRMVYARQQNHGHWQNLEKIKYITLSHCVPEVSMEARSWFVAQLKSFNVDGTEFCT
jgi:hypothetical protein